MCRLFIDRLYEKRKKDGSENLVGTEPQSISLATSFYVFTPSLLRRKVG